MSSRQRQVAYLRCMEIEAELQALAEGRVVDGDPVTVEAELLEAQEWIEWALGKDYLDSSDDE